MDLRRRRRSPGLRVLLGFAFALAAIGSTSNDADAVSEIRGLPLPPGARRLALIGVVHDAGAEREVYVVDAGVTAGDVDDFYARELPRGREHRGWSPCGRSSARSRAWRLGARVLSLEYFVQDASGILEIPEGRVVVIVSEEHLADARDEHPECART